KRNHSVACLPGGRASGRRTPEDLGQLGGRGELELIVTAVGGALVRPPPHEDRRVAEAVPLQVVVLHLAYALDPQGLPREVLALARPALASRHSPRPFERAGPLPPGMTGERVRAQRGELLRQPPPRLRGERRGHADVVQRAQGVVEAEQKRADELARTVLVPAEAAHHAVRGAGMLDLDHRALARLVGRGLVLGDDAVEPGALEAVEPLLRDHAVAAAGREVHGTLRALAEGGLQPLAALPLRQA